MNLYSTPDGYTGGGVGDLNGWASGRLEPLTSARRSQQEDKPFVMLVDDDPAVGALYGLALEAAGFRVAVLSDVSAMFLALEAAIPDVVVLDHFLGGIITGVNALENLRLDPRTDHIPAFILSNHLGELDGQIDRAFAAGAIAWLAKSKTTPADLATRVLEALQADSTK